MFYILHYVKIICVISFDSILEVIYNSDNIRRKILTLLA